MLGNCVIWAPEKYANGNYFQNEVNEVFRKRFDVEPYGNILDIGCGDGQYSHRLAESIKRGQMLGIDSSADMITHANLHWAHEHLSFEIQNIEAFRKPTAFDFALSFWCLHWTNIDLSIPNIYQVLKPGGRLYAVFSSASDNSILQTWQALAKQYRYQALTASYFKSNRTYIYRVINILNQLPFKHVKLHVKTLCIYFPTIDYFRNLLLTMPFMNQFPSGTIEDMLTAFQTICQHKYGGNLYYETRPIFLEAIK